MANFRSAAAKLEPWAAAAAVALDAEEPAVVATTLLLGDGWFKGVTVAVVRVAELTMVKGCEATPAGKPAKKAKGLSIHGDPPQAGV